MTWRPVALVAETIVASGLPLRLARRTMGSALTVAVAVRLAARLAHGEIGFLALGNVTLRARQRCADQAAVDRTIVVTTAVLVLAGIGLGRFVSRKESLGRKVLVGAVGDKFRGMLERQFLVDRMGRRRNGARPRIFEDVLRQGTSLLAARRGRLRLLVFVLGVARRTPRLPDVVLDHGHDDMIGDTALARAVIVQNVTEPKPALLHELPRSGPFGWE